MPSGNPGIPKTAEHRAKLSLACMGRPGYWTGKVMPEYARAAMRVPKGPQSPEVVAKRAAILRGRKRPQSVINELRSRIHTPQSRLKRRLSQLGEKGSAWKGGVSPENERIRQSSEFRDWRQTVFLRDGFSCKKCGTKSRLVPHHIKRFADYPELRFVVGNGITLCPHCHKPTIGHEEEFEVEFMSLVNGGT